MQKEVMEKIVAFCGDLDGDSFNTPNALRMYAYLFNSTCDGYYRVVGELDDIKVCDEFEVTEEEKEFNKKHHMIETIPTIENIISIIGGIRFAVTLESIYVVSDGIVMKMRTDSVRRNITNIYIAANSNFNLERLTEIFKNSLVYNEHENSKNSYKIAFKGQYSIDTTTHKFDDWKTNINDNYNDDLPYAEINEVLTRDSAGLLMFYGMPGTGKTSLIKTLINDNKKTDFIFIDSSVCDSISDGTFLDFLQENKNSVFIFEDCEKLLQSREDGINNRIGTILNLTDGIIAESMKIKFICTFNCKLDKVDPALLRKGRLSLKYEFKELSLEKTKKIYPDATKPMTLADAYNATTKNDFSEKKERKIGF